MKREFREELGLPIEGDFKALKPMKQKGGKIIFAWAVKGNILSEKIASNKFELEWPPKSGKKKYFPEIDKGEWFKLSETKRKINKAQIKFIDEIIAKLS